MIAKTSPIVWFCTHENGSDYYMALFNCSTEEGEISAAIPLDGCFRMTNVWTGEPCGAAEGFVCAPVKPHGAALFRLSRQS